MSNTSGRITTAAEAAEVTSRFIEVMDALVGVVQQETELMRAGRIGGAADLAAAKTDLAQRYMAGASRLRANGAQLARLLPGNGLEALRRRHDAFQGLLQINLTVLATVHAVSEGILRGVSSEMARKTTPETYGASGRMGAARTNIAQPLVISRSL